ncbi:phosphoribosyltransferase family protein [Phytohabitans sp. ZYX-F-186]|uniref:Phosphoribosyltransferase family protein n=1 Tax=Phytohabitans maris TaxID=3071409 RepID=A0ABU0ZCB6_9ACTN|nr:phosphoribosyltransferase family protein [Phytohabitans sp. ZYX-F-186]MDQ7904696.1 phosphoribosyltransferase family protein [Phytohabitans sp. ZYX-F-186]
MNVAADLGRPAATLGWPELAATVHDLARAACADGLPDVVVGVLRGGMIPAVMVAHALAVRTVRGVEVVHTLGDGVDARKSARPQARNLQSLGDLAGLDVLIVDDIAGSGDTAVRVLDLVRGVGAARTRMAVCVVNAANWRRDDLPEQLLSYVGVTVEGWVIFPWEMSVP